MRLVLLVMALAFVPALAAAQEQPPAETPPATEGPKKVEILLEGTDKGGFIFYEVGNPKKNPTLTVPPGAEVTIRFKSVGGFHNVVVEGNKGSAFVDTGEETTYTFTAPTTPGKLPYWCAPHKSAGMAGIIQVGEAAAAPTTGGGDASGLAGDHVIGDTIEVPGCPGGRVPAAIGQGVAGAPTLADYQAKCAAGAGGDAQTQGDEVKQRSGADLVIPISWALIVLGIVAVVWVHKSYKP